MSYDPAIGVWMERDPDQYVDGMNLYEMEEDNPVNRLDPFGSETQITGGLATTRPATNPATQPTTEPTTEPTTQPVKVQKGSGNDAKYTLVDPHNGTDPQGDATVSVTGHNLCDPAQGGKINLEIDFNTQGLGVPPEEEGQLLINGKEVPVTGGPPYKAMWSTDVPSDGKGHSGEIYVAAVYYEMRGGAEKKTGVVLTFSIKWSYECACGAPGEVKTEVVCKQDPGANLPRKP